MTKLTAVSDLSQIDTTANYVFMTSEEKLIGVGKNPTDYVSGIYDPHPDVANLFKIEKQPQIDAVKLLSYYSYITAVGNTFPLIAQTEGDANWSLFQLIFENDKVSLKCTDPGCGNAPYVQLIGVDRVAHLAATVPNEKWGMFTMYKVE